MKPVVHIVYSYITTIVILVGAGSSSKVYAGDRKTDWANDNLRGKVKTLQETTFKVASEQGQPTSRKPTWVRILNYDENGSLTSDYRYSSANELDNYVIYKNDERGNRLEYNGYLGNGQFNGKYRFQYDANDYQIEAAYFDANESIVWTAIYVNDNNGNNTSVTFYDANQNLDKTWTYAYDEQGNMTEHRWYDSQGALFQSQDFKHDAQGRLLEYYQYDGDQTLMASGSYTYHQDGRRETTCSNGTTYWDKVIKNEMGDEIERLGNMSPIAPYKCKYEYDNDGNWVKETIYSGSVPTSINVRTLTYY